MVVRWVWRCVSLTSLPMPPQRYSEDREARAVDGRALFANAVDKCVCAIEDDHSTTKPDLCQEVLGGMRSAGEEWRVSVKKASSPASVCGRATGIEHWTLYSPGTNTIPLQITTSALIQHSTSSVEAVYQCDLQTFLLFRYQ